MRKYQSHVLCFNVVCSNIVVQEFTEISQDLKRLRMVGSVYVVQIAVVVGIRDVRVPGWGFIHRVIVNLPDLRHRVETKPVDAKVQPERHDVLRKSSWFFS